MGSEIAGGFSVVEGCRDNSTISQDVHVPAIGRAPLQLHLILGSRRLHACLEHNVTPAAPVAYVEFRTRENADAANAACDEHLAVGQQRRRLIRACGGQRWDVQVPLAWS